MDFAQIIHVLRKENGEAHFEDISCINQNYNHCNQDAKYEKVILFIKNIKRLSWFLVIKILIVPMLKTVP